MSVVVLDASVAAKWFLPAADETLVDEAFLLLRRYTNAEIQFLLPDLFWAGLANVFWKAIRQGRLAKPRAEVALASLQARRIPTVSRLSIVDLGLAIASAFDRSVYDALYVALAVHSKGQFITADEGLANALAAHLPVKWLGGM